MVCEHLHHLDEFIKSKGFKETSRGRVWSKNCREWVEYPVTLDLKKLRKGLKISEVVHESVQFNPVDGSWCGFFCTEHLDSVIGSHPDFQPGSVPALSFEVKPLPKGWRELTEKENREAFNKFENHFSFKPGTTVSHWPSIQERGPFATFDLEIYKKIDLQKSWSVILEIFQDLAHYPGSEEILVLNYQYSGHAFSPNKAGEEWVIHPIQNCEYVMFLDPNYRFAMVTNPWERTVYAFGNPLENRLREKKVPGFGSIIRSKI